MCLGITGGNHNAPAVVWTCNGAPDQRWHLGTAYPTASQYSQLKNDNGDCLGVQGGSTAPNARIYAWTCQPGVPNQYWNFGPALCGGGQSVVDLGSGLVLSTAIESLADAPTNTPIGNAVVQELLSSHCNTQYWLRVST